MAYEKKTWKDRIVQHFNRRRLSEVGLGVYDVSREEGSITQEGDAFSAANMNDLEGRIEAGLNEKVDKVSGKSLSTNDFTTTEKNKLAGIEAGAEKNIPINDQTPTHSAATTLATLTSGERLSIAFGKIRKAITDLIAHIGNKANPHGVTAVQTGAVPNTRKINGKALSADISLSASDVGAASSSHNHSASDITSGTLPIARGGTGGTTAASARSNIGAAAASHNHSASDITSGALPIERGGTGATTRIRALNSLDAFGVKDHDYTNLNNARSIGIYEVGNSTSNKPGNGDGLGILEVIPTNSGWVLQRFTYLKDDSCYIRNDVPGTGGWSAWKQL